MSRQKILNSLAAPLLAVGFSLVVVTIILFAFGSNVFEVFNSMAVYGTSPRSLTLMLNLATTYYISAVAVAIGFKMNLFNIGVNGQYMLGGMCAAAVAGSLNLPGVVAIPITIFVAIAVGAAWAGVAAWLKVARGVSEVISTIMLNFIALGLISYIIIRTNVGRAASFNVRGTEIIPPNGRMVGWNLLSPTIKVYGFIIVAALIGVLYWFVLNRTVFGYDLRASGLSVSAASASGVNSKRMVVIAMLISGGIAGMVGLPDLLGNDPYSYTLNFPSGYGFTGIAIALLGRNNPIGIAFGAILWAFLDVSSQILDIENVPREIVTIMQGVIVLAVVVAYELVRRNRVKSEQQNVGEALTQKESSAS